MKMNSALSSGPGFPVNQDFKSSLLGTQNNWKWRAFQETIKFAVWEATIKKTQVPWYCVPEDLLLLCIILNAFIGTTSSPGRFSPGVVNLTTSCSTCRNSGMYDTKRKNVSPPACRKYTAVVCQLLWNWLHVPVQQVDCIGRNQHSHP